MNWVWLNGQVVDADQARIAPSDRGFLLGDGAFETLRFQDGALRRWARHYQRLSATLDVLDIAPPDWAVLESAAADLCRRNGFERASVRLTVSRGALGGGMRAQCGDAPTVLLTASALAPSPQAVSLASVDDVRRDGRNISSRCKLTGYADMLLARRRARALGADMAVVLSTHDHLSSADSANLFWMRDGAFYTPSVRCGCLPGVTRTALIEAFSQSGRNVVEGEFEPQALEGAELIFLTNAVMGAVRVHTLDDKALAHDEDMFEAVKAMEAMAD